MYEMKHFKNLLNLYVRLSVFKLIPNIWRSPLHLCSALLCPCRCQTVDMSWMKTVSYWSQCRCELGLSFSLPGKMCSFDYGWCWMQQVSETGCFRVFHMDSLGGNSAVRSGQLHENWMYIYEWILCRWSSYTVISVAEQTKSFPC